MAGNQLHASFVANRQHLVLLWVAVRPDITVPYPLYAGIRQIFHKKLRFWTFLPLGPLTQCNPQTNLRLIRGGEPDCQRPRTLQGAQKIRHGHFSGCWEGEQALVCRFAGQNSRPLPQERS